jgi:hypothetical protein
MLSFIFNQAKAGTGGAACQYSREEDNPKTLFTSIQPPFTSKKNSIMEKNK